MTLKSMARANLLARRLSYGADLQPSDFRKLEDVVADRRAVRAGDLLIRDGDRPDTVTVVLRGLAYRRKDLVSGTREITAILLPGDFCDLHVTLLGRMDHDVRALTACDVGSLSRGSMDDLAANYPRITRALWWCILTETATLRAWLVNIGARPADRAIAHLFCELHTRLDAVGLVEDGSYAFPLTQDRLAEAIGLSEVHVNRTLRTLRTAKLLDWRRREIFIADIDRLKAFCDFDGAYLHLDRAWRK